VSDIRIVFDTDSAIISADILNSNLIERLSAIKAIPQIEISEEDSNDLRRFILRRIEEYGTIARMFSCCLGERYLFLRLRQEMKGWKKYSKVAEKYSKIIETLSLIPFPKVAGDNHFRLDLDSFQISANILNMFDQIPSERRSDLREFILKEMENPSTIYGMLLYGITERYPFWRKKRNWKEYEEALGKAAWPLSKRKVVYL